MAMQYEGTILFERVLKANLPTKTAGSKIFFVVNNVSDTIGEIWASGSDGVVRCYSIAADIATINATLVAVQQQLNVLKYSDIVSLSDNSILNYVMSLPASTKTNIQFAQANDAPDTGWFYAFITRHSNEQLCYASIILHSFGGAMYEGVIQSGMFSGWEQIATTKIVDLSTITFLNGFSRYPDPTFGYISRTGHIVHVNMLLNGTTGVGNNNVCLLPFTPARNEIHTAVSIDKISLEVRSKTDGTISYEEGAILNCAWIKLDFEYTCV